MSLSCPPFHEIGLSPYVLLMIIITSVFLYQANFLMLFPPFLTCFLMPGHRKSILISISLSYNLYNYVLKLSSFCVTFNWVKRYITGQNFFSQGTSDGLIYRLPSKSGAHDSQGIKLYKTFFNRKIFCDIIENVISLSCGQFLVFDCAILQQRKYRHIHLLSILLNLSSIL